MKYLPSALISDLKTEYMNDPTSQPTAFWKFEEWASHQDMSVYETNGIYSFVLGNALVYRNPLVSGYRGYTGHVDLKATEFGIFTKESEGNAWQNDYFAKLVLLHIGFLLV